MAKAVDIAPFKAGQPLLEQLTAERLNAIVEACNRSSIRFGKNVTGRQTPGGITISARGFPANGGVDLDGSFFPTDKTTTIDDEVTNRVLINDGKINGTFPAGMGGGDYTIDLDNPEDANVLAGITFDEETLEITSRFIQETTSEAFPENRIEDGVGFFYWPLFFTYFDDGGKFQIHIQLLGDLTVNFAYGFYNAAPALFVDGGAVSAWIELPDDE